MKKLLAGALTAGLVISLGGLGHGVAAAEETVYTVGGAKMPGVPWYEYTDRSGRGYYPNANRVLVDYPAGIFTGVLPKGAPGVGPSVDIGADSLNTAIRGATSEPATAIGLSEGSLVVDAELARLAHDPTAPPPDQLSFATFGDPAGRHGFGQSFLTAVFPPGTMMPFIDFAIPGPVESQYDTTRVVTSYDGIADFPDRPDNIVSLANALVGSIFFHTGVAFSSPGGVPPQNIRRTVNSRGGETTTYLAPTKFLPLTMPLRLAGVPDETTNQIDAVLQPVVDAGYSRNDNPASRPTSVDPVAGLPPLTDTASVVEANLDGVLSGFVNQQAPSGVDPLAGLAPLTDSAPVAEANLDGVLKQAGSLLPPGIF